jgi:hypothetical protein
MAGNTPAAVKSAKHCAFMNGKYQADREGFLDRSHRYLMFFVIVSGAVSVTTLLPAPVVAWAGAGAAMAGALDLLFDLSVRARVASYLRKGYFEVAAKLEEGIITPAQAQAQMLRFAAEEEPPYSAAHALAENWATGAVYGTKRELPCRVPLWRRVTRHVIRHGGNNFSVDAPPALPRRIVDRLISLMTRRPRPENQPKRESAVE